MIETPILDCTLTCPHCAHVSQHTMPVDMCIFFHECGACGALLKPAAGKCCVFCSYGSVRCPPVQLAMACCAADPAR